MPEPGAGPAGAPAPDAPAPDAPVAGSAGGAPSDRGGAGAGSSPGWREVLVLAALVLAAVFVVELASSLLPPVGEAFSGFPLTIIILVVGTAGLLLLIGRRPGR